MLDKMYVQKFSTERIKIVLFTYMEGYIGSVNHVTFRTPMA